MKSKMKPLGADEGYDLLSYFSDTILFQYDCGLKTLTFTPNLTNRFDNGGGREFSLTDQVGNSLIHPDDLIPLREKLRDTSLDCCNGLQSMNIRFLDRNGEYRWMFCQIRPIVEGQQEQAFVIGKVSDIQEQRCKEERLIEKASIDAMTGVLNRKAAENQIVSRLKEARSGFLFMIDIDNFKTINDTQGHSAGDDALVHFAAEIKRTFRQEDIIGRVGGDEFIVFIADTDLEAVACRKAQQLLTHLSAWKGVTLSASIGIAAYHADGHTYGQLYDAADGAMYRAKQRGKNGYSLWREHRTED